MKNLTHGFTMLESILALSITGAVIGSVAVALSGALQNQAQQTAEVAERAAMTRFIQTLQQQPLPLIGYDDRGAGLALIYANTAAYDSTGAFIVENGVGTVDGARMNVPQQACSRARFDGKALRVELKGNTLAINGQEAGYDISAIRMIPVPSENRIRVALKGARTGQPMSGNLSLHPVGQVDCPVIQPVYVPSESPELVPPIIPTGEPSVMETVVPGTPPPPEPPTPPASSGGTGGNCTRGWGSSAAGRVTITQCPGSGGESSAALDQEAQNIASGLQPVCIRDYTGSSSSTSDNGGVRVTISISPETIMC